MSPFIFTDIHEVPRHLSILQIHELPDRTKNRRTSLGIHVSLPKRADVVSKDWDDHSFHENVMVNRGQKKKVFTDLDKQRRGSLKHITA
jgi:hypothetical protein